jgi:ketosteroid isomerase-like protein
MRYMKHILFSLLMLPATSTFLFSQSTDEQAVRQTLDGIQAALRNNDAETAGRFLTDDYGFVGPGIMMNKVQRLASIKSGQLKYESFNDEDLKVILYGNTAVAKTTVKAKLNGQDVTLVTFTLVKKDEQWQVAGECAGNDCER